VTSDDELGPKPEPEIEPGEPNPGGVDAIDGGANGMIPDLSPEENPAIEDKAPETVMQEVSEGEDTSTEATRDEDGDGDGDNHEPEKESPA
jgi:hypothetical protein